MKPLELFKVGKLDEAIAALSEDLRRDPTGSKDRTFLFELLCFSGDYERAEKQLAILSHAGKQQEMGALLYQGALNAERVRQELFFSKKFPQSSVQAGARRTVRGVIDGAPFQNLVDADPRVGANLEVFAAGSYFWIPFSLIASVEISAPRRLRDLLWIPAVIRTVPEFQGKEMGETLLPALTPFSGKHPNDPVRLGRETVWEEDEKGQELPVGQKMYLADGEERPILNVRKLEFAPAMPIS